MAAGIARRTLVACATFPILLATTTTACSDDGGDRDAFCATAQRFAADNPAAALSRFDPDDPAAAAVQLRDAAGRLGDWADEAPGDVGDDVRTLVDTATALAEQFETGDDATIDSAAVEAASGRVVAYVSDECGVDLEA